VQLAASRTGSFARPHTIATVTDDDYMDAALAEAKRALVVGEVPVGAVVVIDGRILGAGYNQPINAADPTAHAEVIAIRAAARAVGNYRLTGAAIYVTVEPCMMCVGAMVHARIGLVVYGAAEPKAGALESAQRAHEAPGLNHRLTVRGGVRDRECRALMQLFFRDRRGPRPD
jgi:tRNA(adenine34) deaminase